MNRFFACRVLVASLLGGAPCAAAMTQVAPATGENNASERAVATSLRDPEFITVGVSWSPEDGSLSMSLPDDLEGDSAVPLSIVRLVGPCADPRLDQAAEDMRLQIGSTLGASAGSTYTTAFATALRGALQTIRSHRPGALVSVAGLPIESNSESARVANETLRDVIATFDVLVSSRSFLRGSGVALTSQDVAASLPITMAVADGRRVMFRSSEGWSSVGTQAGKSVSNPRSEPKSSEPDHQAEPSERNEVALGPSRTSDLASAATRTEAGLDPASQVDRVADAGPTSEPLSVPAEPFASGGTPAIEERSSSSLDDDGAGASSRSEGQKSRNSVTVPGGGGGGRGLSGFLDPASLVGGGSAGLLDSLRGASSGGSGSRGAGSGGGAGRSSLGGRAESASQTSTGGAQAPATEVGGGSAAPVGLPSAAAPSTVPTPSAAPTPPAVPSAPTSPAPPATSPPSIVIPIQPAAAPSTPSAPGSPVPPAPTAPLPPPPTWNPNSTVNPSTPVTGTPPASPATVVAGTNPLRFGRSDRGEVLGSWAAEPFRTSDGNLWVGVQAWTPNGVESVRFLVSGIGATSVSEPRYHPHRGLTAYWISVNPSQVSTDSVSVSAVVVPKGTLEPLESLPREIRKRGSSWQVERFRDGWIAPEPSSDSRLIYVDSVGGNDAAAAAAKGRGYYLPGDPEIGPDPTNPVGPIVAYATAFEAHKRLRLSNSTGVDGSGFPVYGNNNPQPSTVTGFPDWILLKRGGNYAVSQQLVHPNSGVTESYNLGMLLGGHQTPTVGWNQALGRLVYWAGPWRGRSASEPSVVAAWGPTSDPRPIVNGFNIGGGTRHVRVVSLDLMGREMTWGWGSDGFTGGGVLIEDCTMRSLGGISLGQFSFADGVTVRRCVVTGNFNPGGHNQGFFLGSSATSDPGHVFTIEECVFDRNGYKEDPNQPQTWTARTVSSLSAGELAAGTGVQPTRTYFDRNLYLSSYADLKLRGCIISRGGGGSTVQMRQGGVSERNLFIWNQQASSTTTHETKTQFQKSSLVRQNAVLHDDCFLPPGGSGIGLMVGGASDDVAVVEDNVVAHFHRGTNGGESIGVFGKPSNGAIGNEPSPLMLGVVKDNAIFQQNGVGGIVVERSSSPTYQYVVLDADVTGNEVSANRLLSGQGDGAKPAAYTYSGNKFHSTGSSATWFLKQWTGQDYRFFPTYVDLAGWKAAGFDADVSAVSTDLAAFKTAVGWTAPERDIVSYMQSVDPTYVVNEDVFVDDDSTGPKQATRQKVWQVLQAGIPGSIAGMSESHAKLTARRYHAFITFIQRAKANRKGAWDPRWTADAVNDYIRDGFGKPSVRPGLGN